MASTTAAKGKQRRRCFLETSAIYYDRFGHPLMKTAIRDAVAGGIPETSNFIRMEYLRGVAISLIELYFLIKESASVSDALIDWTQSQGYRPRRLIVVLQTVARWVEAQEDWTSKDPSLARLGNLIFRIVWEFDEVYLSRARDDLKCELGKLKIPSVTFSEQELFDFYDRFERIRIRPSCELCKFKAHQERRIQRKRVDLISKAQTEKYKRNAGYVTQAERTEKELSRGRALPICDICRNLGDTIIALHLSGSPIVVTADRSFVAFGEILGFDVHLLPSLAALKAAAVST